MMTALDDYSYRASVRPYGRVLQGGRHTATEEKKGVRAVEGRDRVRKKGEK